MEINIGWINLLDIEWVVRQDFHYFLKNITCSRPASCSPSSKIITTCFVLTTNTLCTVRSLIEVCFATFNLTVLFKSPWLLWSLFMCYSPSDLTAAAMATFSMLFSKELKLLQSPIVWASVRWGRYRWRTFQCLSQDYYWVLGCGTQNQIISVSHLLNLRFWKEAFWD